MYVLNTVHMVIMLILMVIVLVHVH